jgi:lipopolysaccharide/colanic/teichoic acid biosynthesis glycosyltransferase
MIKLRSMVVNADKNGVSSTAGDDRRITLIGAVVRRCKLDELMQLVNVVKGDMSLVGPRPQVLKGGVDRYTAEEMRILTVRPGITDFASIVFSDESEILRGSSNPDALYNEIIRPWKSRLALSYVENQTLWLDVQLIFTTILALFSRRRATKSVESMLLKMNADPRLIRVASRIEPLYFYPPP